MYRITSRSSKNLPAGEANSPNSPFAAGTIIGVLLTGVVNGVEADVQDVLSDGALDCGCLWKCEDLGYITVAVAKYLLDGNTPADGDVIEGWSEPLIVTNDGHDVYMTDHGSDFEFAG
ncbi:MAG: hypothetical protein IJR48_09485 [Oscillibacter sp.]|nr:hypothetical protein [Oscillibacter sp.]MBQ9618583.1 hypothetical protein [Oscillibacter sp.]